LESWAVGDRLLRFRRAGVELDHCVQAELRRGAVPPGMLGARLLLELTGEVEPLVASAERLTAGAPATFDVRVELPDGRSVVDTVSDVYDATITSVVYSRLGPNHRLRAWVSLLMLTAARPDCPWRACTIGRGEPGQPRRSMLGPLEPATAARLLAELIDLRDQGMCAPLPIAPKASYKYAESRARGDTPARAIMKAQSAWHRYGGGGEDDDPAHLLVWGSVDRLDALPDGHPLAEPGASEPTRFGDLALRLWTPLFAAERVELL
jgi:exodeoxyribonuclease V gamma subunit